MDSPARNGYAMMTTNSLHRSSLSIHGNIYAGEMFTCRDRASLALAAVWRHAWPGDGAVWACSDREASRLRSVREHCSLRLGSCALFPLWRAASTATTVKASLFLCLPGKPSRPIPFYTCAISLRPSAASWCSSRRERQGPGQIDEHRSGRPRVDERGMNGRSSSNTDERQKGEQIVRVVHAHTQCVHVCPSLARSVWVYRVGAVPMCVHLVCYTTTTTKFNKSATDRGIVLAAFVLWRTLFGS